MSVADVRRGRACTSSSRPRPDSSLGRAYDALRRGETVTMEQRNVPALRDTYGMELENIRGHGYRLIGEWEGLEFVPVERMVQDE